MKPDRKPAKPQPAKPASKKPLRAHDQSAPEELRHHGRRPRNIVVGFITLASGSITLAPILLVLGYCVLIPVGLLVK